MFDMAKDDRLSGLRVTNQDGERFGRVTGALVDAWTGEPSWIIVSRGLFGRHRDLLPLAGARLAEGGRLLVPHFRDESLLAPQCNPADGLSPAQERELLRHYNVGHGPDGTTAPRTGVDESSVPVDHPHGALPPGRTPRHPVRAGAGARRDPRRVTRTATLGRVSAGRS